MSFRTPDAVAPLFSAAFDEARALGDGWVGTEHILLALLARPSVASDVLGDLGLTHARLAEHLRGRRYDPPAPRYDPEKGLVGPNPAGNELTGWARGLAAGWGMPGPSPEHWLLAMVYSVGVPSLLYYFGITQQAVLDGLRGRGVRVPDVDPPWYRPWRGHRQVEVSEARLGPVLRLLAGRHPPGSEWRWGFNWLPGEPRRARVDSEDGIDLDAVVAEAEAERGDDPVA